MVHEPLLVGEGDSPSALSDVPVDVGPEDVAPGSDDGPGPPNVPEPDPPPPPLPPPHAPPPVHPRKRHRLGPDDVLLELPFGTLRYYHSRKEIVAHCAAHGEQCRLSRTVVGTVGKPARGRPVGLSAAWFFNA